MSVLLTHVGGPTVLVEVDGWRLLTDPTFDPPGSRYAFGWGTGARKVAGPALSVDEIGPIDAVLLSHDGHADNLDTAGRALLSTVGTVVTTRAAARRLGGQSIGLAPWASTTLTARGRPALTITATPARHGPPLSRPVVGQAVGFALHREVTPPEAAAVWFTGDTVMYRGLREVAARLRVDVAVVHLGAVRFRSTGPVRFTLDAAEAADLTLLARPRVVVPVHYEGWSHFRQDRAGDARRFDAAGLTDRVRWLELGTPTDVGLPVGS
jgi:L-ascorbate metabolism protein UlaG (beta-lactamase superfamily)